MAKCKEIEGFKCTDFSCKMRNGVVAKHDYYYREGGNKVLVIMQELPGINEYAIHLANHFCNRGYTVVLPYFAGARGGEGKPGNGLARIMCLVREFKVFVRKKSSPIIDYLAGLCLMLKEKYQVEGVGVIGMCFSGNFAISMMANETVLAAYAGQPSLPFLNKKALHMSGKEIELVKNRLDIVGPMHCAGFEVDKFCGSDRLDAIEKTFNEVGNTRIIMHRIKNVEDRHSVLTREYYEREDRNPDHKEELEEIFNKVSSYFDEKLG